MEKMTQHTPLVEKEVRTESFEKFLHDCQRGDLMQVLLYVKMGNNFTLENNLALRLAIHSDQLEVTKYLMSKGANPYMADTHYPIIEASGLGYLKMVKYLWLARHNYFKKIDPSHEQMIMNLALDKALDNDNLEMIEFWLEKGAQIQYCHNNNNTIKDSIVNTASLNDINIESNKNWNYNGLLKVCGNGNLKVLSYLLEHNYADIYFDNESHLIEAANNQQYETVKYLLEKGCDKSKLLDQVEKNNYFDILYAIEKSLDNEELKVKMNDLVDVPVTSHYKGKI